MDKLFKKLEEVHTEVTKVRKMMKVLVQRQNEIEKKTFKLEDSEYKVGRSI